MLCQAACWVLFTGRALPVIAQPNASQLLSRTQAAACTTFLLVCRRKWTWSTLMSPSPLHLGQGGSFW